MRGHVVDFIELPNWPVFNVADSSIVGAAVLIAYLSFRGVPFSTPRTPTDEGAVVEDDEPVSAEPARQDGIGPNHDAEEPEAHTPPAPESRSQAPDHGEADKDNQTGTTPGE
jgi:signal peptidase II